MEDDRDWRVCMKFNEALCNLYMCERCVSYTIDEQRAEELRIEQKSW